MDSIEQPSNYEVPADSWTLIYDSENNRGIIWLDLAEASYTISSPYILVIGTKEELEDFIIEQELLKPEYLTEEEE